MYDNVKIINEWRKQLQNIEKFINDEQTIFNSAKEKRDQAFNALTAANEEVNKALLTDDALKIFNAQDKYNKIKQQYETANSNYEVRKRKLEDLKAQKNDLIKQLQALGVKGYKKGGIIDYTGPAIVHGSKQHPEGIVSAEAFEQLRKMMLTSVDFNSSIVDLQNGLNQSVNNIRNVNNTNSSDSVSIDNLVLQITSGTISNDYDARRAADIVMDEIMKIANKSGVRSVSRR